MEQFIKGLEVSSLTRSRQFRGKNKEDYRPRVSRETPKRNRRISDFAVKDNVTKRANWPGSDKQSFAWRSV
jgi:hypothetical protein